MASLPNNIPCDLSSGLKLSYEPQNLPNLINDLRENNCGDEFKLFVLNGYLRKCQTELPVAGVLEQEHSQYQSMTLKGIDILKMEIARINKAIGFDVSDSSPLDFSEPNNYVRLKKQRVDLNNPGHCPEQCFGSFTHPHVKRKETKLSTGQVSSVFYDPSPREEEGPTDLNLKAKERSMADVMLRPLRKPIWKNNRRAWTEELHARFVTVLQVLGGPEVATPKRIRDGMQVDGLTIDQVKSHLQKYRVSWRSGHPEVAAKKPLKLKLHWGEITETSGEGSSINMGGRRLSGGI